MKALTLTLAILITLTCSLTAVAQTFQTNQAEMTIENEDGTYLLKWETEREVNSSYFIIEVSNDGINFSTLAVKKASGNSQFPHKYEMPLNEADTFANYRVKLVTMDGLPVISNTVVLRIINSELMSNGIAQK